MDNLEWEDHQFFLSVLLLYICHLQREINFIGQNNTCYFLFIILVKTEFLQQYHLNTQYNTLLNTLNKKGSWVFELTDCHLPSEISKHLTDYNYHEVKYWWWNQKLKKNNVVVDKITGWRYLNEVEEVGNNWGVLLRREKSGHNHKMVSINSTWN